MRAKQAWIEHIALAVATALDTKFSLCKIFVVAALRTFHVVNPLLIETFIILHRAFLSESSVCTSMLTVRLGFCRDVSPATCCENREREHVASKNPTLFAVHRNGHARPANTDVRLVTGSSNVLIALACCQAVSGPRIWVADASPQRPLPPRGNRALSAMPERVRRA